MFRFLSSLIFILFLAPVFAEEGYLKRQEVKEFIEEMVVAHGFDRTYLNDSFRQVDQDQSVIDLMNRPYEARPWYDYRDRFLTEQRIQGGVDFWHRHADLIKTVSEQYQVAPEIIVAILGVETSYGSNQGRFSVLQTLATLAFDYPRRASFFRRELGEYLLLVREHGFAPLLMKGSYAGAMGMPQFMPSSYRAYAVDYAQRGQSDLFFDIADILASVANYLKTHGWQYGGPIAQNVEVKSNRYQQLPVERRPHLTKQTLLEHDIVVNDAAMSHNQKARLVLLEGEKGEEVWLGFNNFYVITRYNTSAQYALAVYLLGQAIRERL